VKARTFVERAWAGEAGWPGRALLRLLAPLESVFRAGVRRRNRAFDAGRGVKDAPAVPVVSVGNLSVGGTGKTPVAGWVVRELLEGGRRPGLLSRGYGEDELALHRRWNPGAPVHADRDRVAGAEALVRGGCGSIVLDDGFQHRRLPRSLDIVLVAAEQGLPGPLLPRGPFREPAGALGRAHAVIVTRKSATEGEAVELAGEARRRAGEETLVARAWLRPGRLVPMAGWAEGTGTAERPGTAEAAAGPGPGGGGPVTGARESGEVPGPGAALVVTSVANPASVVAGVESIGVPVEGVRSFRDHHDFSRREVEDLRFWASGRPVIVTEKDAVKLIRIPAASGVSFWVLTQALVWEAGGDALRGLIISATEKGGR
jgi:tetraacyldisaccharide 4'-kinase